MRLSARIRLLAPHTTGWPAIKTLLRVPPSLKPAFRPVPRNTKDTTMRLPFRFLATALLATLSAVAHAGFVTSSQGVDFDLQTLNANTFTLDIHNANHATGSWASASNLGYLAFKGLGDLSGLTGVSVTVSSNAGTPITWALASTSGELGGQGCNKNAQSGGICLDGVADLPLTGDLLFTISLIGSGINLDTITAPHLKVGFTAPGKSKPIGDLLSTVLQAEKPSTIPNDDTVIPTDGQGGGSVPEPASLALAGLALAGLALTRRRA